MRLMQMSVSAGVLIGIILLLRQGERRLFSARFIYLLWFVAAARMLLPVSVPVKLPGAGNGSVWQVGDGMDGNLMFFQNQGPGFEGQAVQAGAAGPEALLRLLVIPWALVCSALLIAYAWSYVRQYRQLGESIPLKDNGCIDNWKEQHPLRRNVSFLYFDRILAPVTYGIWNTRIVFPKTMDFQDTRSLNHILRHEYVHIRRFDNLWKIVVLTAVCLHWFNPMAWVMWSCFNRDLELACDQRAVDGMDRAGRLDYAMTLLRYAEKGHKVSLLCSGFGKSCLKERITILMKHNKRTKIGIVSSILVMAMSMTVFASAAGDTGISTSREVAGETGSLGADGTEGKSPARILADTPQFKEYEAMGLYYDPVMDWISYKDRVVGYLSDEYSPGRFNRMEDLAGSLCLVGTRNQGGTLTGFKEVEETESLKHTPDRERRMAQNRALIREYGDYGLSVDTQTGYPSYGGKLVEAILDTGGCGIQVNGSGVGNPSGITTCLQIERDGAGAVTGVKEMTPQEMSGILQQTIGVYRSDEGWKGGGN